MILKNIHDQWGTVIEFDSPFEVFNHDKNHWRSMLYERKLIVFKRMKFRRVDYANFCSFFGNLWSKEDYKYSHERTEEVEGGRIISPISNLTAPRLGQNEMQWHSDIPNKKDKPFPIRTIWMVKNPNPDSGLTSWLNVEEGLATLPSELKSQLDSIKIIQQSWWAKDTDIQELDFVKTHPVTGQQSLRLNFFCDPERNITDAWIRNVKIDGKLLNPRDTLAPFFKHLESCLELNYTHRWDDFDIVVYDNWSFVHNRTKLEFDPKLERLMYRTNIDHDTA
jgi:alpha-ketoglutarate-dependent taurine dioxygenase